MLGEGWDRGVHMGCVHGLRVTGVAGEHMQGGRQGEESRRELLDKKRCRIEQQVCVHGLRVRGGAGELMQGGRQGVGWKRELLERKRHSSSVASSRTSACLGSSPSHAHRPQCYWSCSSRSSGIAPLSALQPFTSTHTTAYLCPSLSLSLLSLPHPNRLRCYCSYSSRSSGIDPTSAH